MPPLPDLNGRLSDGVVELRSISAWDIPEILIAHQDDPELHVRLGQDRPPTGAQLGSEVEKAAGHRATGTRTALTLLEPGGEDCRGRIDVHNVRWEHLRAEIGIWVAPQLRGRGIARHALVLASAWLFDACGLERVALLTDPANVPMRRAAAAAGFVEEGTLRSYGIERGGRVDLVSLSLLPGDLGR